MAALNLTETLAAEAAALAAGWSEERLLNLAGERLGHALGRFFPNPGTLIGYLGKGHNAGDTLVALRVLRDQYAWTIRTRNAFPIQDCLPLTRQKWHELGLDTALDHAPAWPDLKRPLVLLDGLLGSGSRGTLREPLLSLAAEMERLRHEAGARVAAVDFPSGIDADSGLSSPGGVTADVTFMIGNAKCGLLSGHAANATGALALVPMEALRATGTGEMELIAPQTLTFAKSHRPFDFHKGMAGRVALVAGSTLYPGAAVLTAIGALRGGAGLITLHVPLEAAAQIASRCPPEIIVRAYGSLKELRHLDCDALVVGCGLDLCDASTHELLLDLIANFPAPAVIDASALNLIAQSGMTEILAEQHVITPHPGEFQRLAPDLSGLTRELAARTFADRCPATLLLKGGRSIVTRSRHPLYCNATGNPGMATGGQGDLLAGLIGARLAMGDSPLEAATLAAWLSGRAAEIALHDPSLSEESLSPCDVAQHLGGALLDWKSARR
jgi:NAD(P)H-hydrate epimerase